jgi:hypothetical protein
VAVVVKTVRDGCVAVAEVFDVDGVGWMSIGSTVAVSSLAALDLVAEDGAGIVVFDSTALVVEAALESLGKPGTLSITDPPFTGEDTLTFVVEVEPAPVAGSLSVILDVPVEAEYSRRE